MIRRKVEHLLKKQLSKKEITILIGARQVGKTTVIKKIISELRGKGNKVVFFNLDFESDARYFESQELLLKKIRLELGDSPGYVFVDEIQRKEDAGRFLKGIYDLDLPYKFVVTGSGSLQLKEKISESLTGRKRLIEMHPVSFEEFVDYKTKYKYSDRLELFYEVSSEKMDSLLSEYLAYGSYPQLITENNQQQKKEIINEIFTSYITRDITYLLGVRSPDKFVLFIQLLAVQRGSIINYARLASDINISVETLKRYLWFAEHTFVIYVVTPFYTNNKKELTKSPTIYFNDLGMNNFARNEFGRINKTTGGFVFQNFVFQLLQQKYDNVTDRICYWRTKDKAEVDFVIRQVDKIFPIEVKFTHLKKPTISRSYRSFIEKYQPQQGYIINLSLDEEVNIGVTRVSIIPYWKLL
ncbi:MAG: ATP-binding protein [Cyclobacteriaceae bacterium]|nr:ATP-binding protein [Cyclobacteriaceae bacterium]